MADDKTIGVKHSPVYPMIIKLTVLTNALAFFGKELGKRTPIQAGSPDLALLNSCISKGRKIHAFCT